MPKLKIDVEDEKPVTLLIKLPAGIHRDLVAYAELLNREGGQSTEPKSLSDSWQQTVPLQKVGALSAAKRAHEICAGSGV